MKKTTIRLVFGLIALTYVLTHFMGHAHAQSSLGIGTNEAIVPSTGLFGDWLAWINLQQQHFYRALTGALTGSDRPRAAEPACVARLLRTASARRR